jgi:hypothetical protein
MLTNSFLRSSAPQRCFLHFRTLLVFLQFTVRELSATVIIYNGYNNNDLSFKPEDWGIGIAIPGQFSNHGISGLGKGPRDPGIAIPSEEYSHTESECFMIENQHFLFKLHEVRNEVSRL